MMLETLGGLVASTGAVAVRGGGPLDAIPWGAAMAWLLVIGAGVACLWWVRRGGVPRGARGGLGDDEAARLRWVGAVRLGPRAQVVALRVGRRILVVGSSDKGVEALTHWEVPETAPDLEERAEGTASGRRPSWRLGRAGASKAAEPHARATEERVRVARRDVAGRSGTPGGSAPLSELDRIRQRLEAWRAAGPPAGEGPEPAAPPSPGGLS